MIATEISQEPLRPLDTYVSHRPRSRALQRRPQLAPLLQRCCDALATGACLMPRAFFRSDSSRLRLPSPAASCRVQFLTVHFLGTWGIRMSFSCWPHARVSVLRPDRHQIPRIGLFAHLGELNALAQSDFFSGFFNSPGTLIVGNHTSCVEVLQSCDSSQKTA
jgi:hypothetical protein